MTGQSTSPPRAWMEIDLGALVNNGRAIAAHAGRPLLPMIKADAYGMGAVPVARALEQLQPWGFGVATVREGAELRHAGIARPILVVTPLLEPDLDLAAEFRLTPSLGTAGSIRRWSRTGLPWHLSIDTGMSRAGIEWWRVSEIVEVAAGYPPEGAFTHLHSAELPDESARLQLARFREAVGRLHERPSLLHAENSAGVQRLGTSEFDLVRPGLFLYGVDVPELGPLRARHVLGLSATIVDTRVVPDGETISYLQTYRAVGERRIATLPLGYADGYPRAASHHGWAIVNGRRVPVAGLVTMDMLMLDVTEVACEVGDVALLIGDRSSGAPDVATLAWHAGLSAYELLVAQRNRLERVYLGM